MSTTFWLPSDTTAAVSPAPSVVDWTHINTVSRTLPLIPGSSALTSLVYQPDAGDDLVAATAMAAQFVSGILPPQTIPAQVIGIGVRTLEDLATNNLTLRWKIYAVDVTGASVLGTLIPINSGAVEFGTVITGKVDFATSTEVILAVNFRLVLELGWGGTPAVAGGHNGAVNLGEAYDGSGVIGNSASVGTPTLIFTNNLTLSALPSVNDVEDGVSFGDPASPSLGTLIVPTEAQVEDGVAFGPNGSLEGTFEGSGGGTVVLIRR